MVVFLGMIHSPQKFRSIAIKTTVMASYTAEEIITSACGRRYSETDKGPR